MDPNFRLMGEMKQRIVKSQSEILVKTKLSKKAENPNQIFTPIDKPGRLCYVNSLICFS